MFAIYETWIKIQTIGSQFGLTRLKNINLVTPSYILIYI